MSERTSYAPGTPNWVDLATPDVDVAAEFYGPLFGWEIPEREDSAEMGGYRRAIKDGADVAGAMPLMAEGQPPAWTNYVSVEDAAATAEAIAEAGGSVISEVMDVMGLGKMAIFADPTGAVFGIWEPGTFVGAARVNEHGALGWNEVNTRDPEAAKAFYTSVFGWETEELDMGELGAYTNWRMGDKEVGGMIDITGRVPDEVPAHWLAYFVVEDVDVAAGKVGELGGGVSFGPIDVPAGRFAVVRDPAGAVFAVIKPNAVPAE